MQKHSESKVMTTMWSYIYSIFFLRILHETSLFKDPTNLKLWP